MQKNVSVNNYIISNFNHCPLVWIFFVAKSLKKLKVFKKEHFDLYYDYSISCEGLLEKAGEVKISVYGLKILYVEIYKTINSLNPEFMNNIFTLKGNKKLVREQ